MRILIFKTSPKWRYCAGAIVVTADDFTDAQKVMEKEDAHEKLHATEGDVPDDASNHWVLVASFTVGDEVEKKVVLYDYNWA